TTAARTPACRKCWLGCVRTSRRSRSDAETPTDTRHRARWPPCASYRRSLAPTSTGPCAYGCAPARWSWTA
ncbi:MAG: hypothetical protein AVDCRST_MAG69-2863, partial [uncultured Solirubrobacteraceae bacterium]